METACTSCAHRGVCQYKDDFLKAQEAAMSIAIHDEVIDETGKPVGRTRYVSNLGFIKAIKLECVHYIWGKAFISNKRGCDSDEYHS